MQQLGSWASPRTEVHRSEVATEATTSEVSDEAGHTQCQPLLCSSTGSRPSRSVLMHMCLCMGIATSLAKVMHSEPREPMPETKKQYSWTKSPQRKPCKMSHFQLFQTAVTSRVCADRSGRLCTWDTATCSPTCCPRSVGSHQAEASPRQGGRGPVCGSHWSRDGGHANQLLASTHQVPKTSKRVKQVLETVLLRHSHA